MFCVEGGGREGGSAGCSELLHIVGFILRVHSIGKPDLDFEFPNEKRNHKTHRNSSPRGILIKTSKHGFPGFAIIFAFFLFIDFFLKIFNRIMQSCYRKQRSSIRLLYARNPRYQRAIHQGNGNENHQLCNIRVLD